MRHFLAALLLSAAIPAAAETINWSSRSSQLSNIFGLTPCAIVFGGSDGKGAQDAANLCWDDTNNILKIGSPTTILKVTPDGTVADSYVSFTPINAYAIDNSGTVSRFVVTGNRVLVKNVYTNSDPGNDTIGLFVKTFNNEITTPTSLWGHYVEARAVAGSANAAGKLTFGMEVSPINNNVSVTSDPFAQNPATGIEALRLSCGNALADTTDCTTAITFNPNTHKFATGSLFVNGSLRTDAGLTHPSVISMPSGTNGYGLTWYRQTGFASPAWQIYSTASSADGYSLDLGNNLATFSTPLVATSYNNVALTQQASLATITIGSGKTFAFNNSVTWNGTDGTTMTLPASSQSIIGASQSIALSNKSISLGSNTLTATSAQLRTALSDELGTGAALFDGATPTSLTLTNATGLPIAGGGTGASSLSCTSGQRLTSNGTTFSCSNTAGAGVMTQQVLTSGTAYTATSGASVAVFECVAGGAGGGGADGNQTTSASAAGGGGSGGYFLKRFTTLTGITYAIGAGGAGGAAGTNTGVAGGDTTVTQSATTYTAKGGSGGVGGTAGTVASSTAGGSGGAVSTNADINSGGDAGTAGILVVLADATGGKGGVSHYGGGGNGGRAGSVAGAAAANYGAGGGGGRTTTADADQAGGAGSQGVCYVTEYQ